MSNYVFCAGDNENFLGELTIPSSWWPPLTTKENTQFSSFKIRSYSIEEMHNLVFFTKLFRRLVRIQIRPYRKKNRVLYMTEIRLALFPNDRRKRAGREAAYTSYIYI